MFEEKGTAVEAPAALRSAWPRASGENPHTGVKIPHPGMADGLPAVAAATADMPPSTVVAAPTGTNVDGRSKATDRGPMKMGDDTRIANMRSMPCGVRLATHRS